MTATAGRTSDHTCDLIERHRIAFGRETTSAQAMQAARTYGQAHGFDVGRLSIRRELDPNATYVEFDVVVGKGDIDPDQSTPGALDSWRWSGPRVAWWRDILNRADRRQGRHLAEVRSISRDLPPY